MMDTPIGAFLGDGPANCQPPAPQQQQHQPQQQSPYQGGGGGAPSTNGQGPYANMQAGGIAPHFVQHGQQPQHQQPPQQPQQFQPQQYQPPQQSYQPPAVPQYQSSAFGGGPSRSAPAGGAPGGQSLDNIPLTPLGELTPYSRRWKVKARVIDKGDIRPFKSGQGQLFSIEMSDGKNDMRAAFFGSAVDKFFPLLRERSVYTFSGGQVKRANKMYNPKGDFEITFGDQSEIVQVADDGDVPAYQIQYNFKSLASLEQEAPNSMIDVAAVVGELKEATEVNLRAGGTKAKRDIVLIDDSGASVQLTVWGETIAQTDGTQGRVIYLKNVKVGDFGGRSLSNLSQTKIDVEAAGQRGDQLRAWYQAHGREPCRNPLTSRGGGSGPRQTLEDCKEEDKTLGIEEPGGIPDPNLKYVHFHTVVPVTLQYMAHDRPPYYLACPAEVPGYEQGKPPRCCNKKVENINGQWQCGLGHTSQEPTARWMFSPTFGDETGSQIMRVFDEAGNVIMGCQANALARIWDQKDSNAAAADEVDNIFRAAQWKRWRLRVKSKRELWQDEERVSMTVMEASPVNLVKEGMELLGSVNASLSSGAVQH